MSENLASGSARRLAKLAAPAGENETISGVCPGNTHRRREIQSAISGGRRAIMRHVISKENALSRRCHAESGMSSAKCGYINELCRQCKIARPKKNKEAKGANHSMGISAQLAASVIRNRCPGGEPSFWQYESWRYQQRSVSVFTRALKVSRREWRKFISFYTRRNIIK